MNKEAVHRMHHIDLLPGDLAPGAAFLRIFDHYLPDTRLRFTSKVLDLFSPAR